MKALIPLLLLLYLSADGQAPGEADRSKIYRVVTTKLTDGTTPLINEIFTRIEKYDVDDNEKRWFYGPFPGRPVICLVPVRYEPTLIAFLQTRGIQLDTAAVFAQLDHVGTDSLSRYVQTGTLIPFTRAPLKPSVFGNLFKKTKAIGFSAIVFDDANRIAFLKLQVYARKKQSRYNPSSIIVLQKGGDEWVIIGTLKEKA
jgi:hypothetical protein